MHDTGTEIMRGLCHHGLYREDKEFVKRTNSDVFMTHTNSILFESVIIFSCTTTVAVIYRVRGRGCLIKHSVIAEESIH
jgi:hypothetical protein